MFFRTYQHLIPNARAWRLTAAKKLRQYFEGLAQSADEVKTSYDRVYLELLPESTQSLSDWENFFALPSTVTGDADRRDRISAAWAALGGQSPSYIQGVLRAAGFDVYVYDWFDDTNTLRDPNLVIGTGDPAFTTGADGLEMHADQQNAKAGRSQNLRGRFLINKTVSTEAVPLDSDKHKFIMYIGGATFGEFATVPTARRAEFHTLCLKICPAHLWIGLLVDYS